MSNAERQARWRDNNRVIYIDQHRERMRKLRAEGREKPRAQSRTSMRRFIALDGEGGGVDDLRRQNYQLLYAADVNGFSSSLSCETSARSCGILARLRTDDCLDFILSMPKDAILVGFFFGYDVTQILRDFPRERMMDLFASKEDRKNHYTYWGHYGVEYIPKQYFRVCRIDRNSCKVIPGSARTINEVGGFFQKPFVEVLKDRAIGDKKTVAMIARMKEQRERFDRIGEREAQYCKAECVMLAQIMEGFRQDCIAANCVPRYWRGAGHLSARLHELKKTPLRKHLKRSKIFDRWAQEAYYGGRFEAPIIGDIKGTVFEYDINSAYPAAMVQLPCLVHGRWKRFRGSQIPDEADIYLADILFRHPNQQLLCGFPIREKGRLYFPKMGAGVYWSPEIEAAKRNGAEAKVTGGFAHIACPQGCKPFAWVQDLYDYRKSLGSDTLGYPIKLGINGLYGKFAQRIGHGPWRDYVMAGLITASVRAMLIDAARQSPASIIYIATDGIFSRKPLKLDFGEKLGQWKETKRDGMFIVQSGIYWSGNSAPKTRGIPRSVIIEHRQEFERAWRDWLAAGAENMPPVVPVFINQFIGLRAALARGKPWLAGSWLADRDDGSGIRNIDFNWTTKRKPYGWYLSDQSMVTAPLDGRRYLRSESYDPSIISEFDQWRIDHEDDPDHEYWGNSGE